MYSCSVGMLRVIEFSVITLPYICHSGQPSQLLQLYSGEDGGELLHCNDFFVYMSWWPTWQTVYSCTVRSTVVSECNVMTLPYICHGGILAECVLFYSWEDGDN